MMILAEHHQYEYIAHCYLPIIIARLFYFYKIPFRFSSYVTYLTPKSFLVITNNECGGNAHYLHFSHILFIVILYDYYAFMYL